MLRSWIRGVRCFDRDLTGVVSTLAVCGLENEQAPVPLGGRPGASSQSTANYPHMKVSDVLIR